MSNKWLFVWLLLLVGSFVYAQPPERTSGSKKANDAYDLGARYFSMRNLDAAAEQLRLAIQEDPRFIEAYLVLAEVYEDSGKPVDAIETYKKGLPINPLFYPYGYITLGNLLFGEGMYQQAMDNFQYFMSLNTNNPDQTNKARLGTEKCNFALNALNHPVDFKPVNIGETVNTELDEYWPSLSADEKTLFITRLIPSDDPAKKVQEDFFISEWKDTAWSIVSNAGRPLNTPDNEGAQTISGDGRTMVFTACNRRDGKGRCDLYASEKEGGQWTIPVNLGSPVNTPYRETQPALSADGRTLYFSSDRPGGKGQHDIWTAHRNDNGLWSVPVNLGDTINTPGIEMSPFIHEDNQTLYFSSNGHLGMGGYDLFVSRKDSNGHWQIPENMGYPINTNRDEIGLIVNARGNKAYYSSDKDKYHGKDIFVFDLPVNGRPLMVTYMKGKVFDAQDHHFLKAEFRLTDLESGKDVYRSLSDSITGEFLVSIPVNRNYMLHVIRTGYLFYSGNFTLKNIFEPDKPFIKDVPLQPLRAGNSIVLNNVFFETDSYTLKKESRLELDKVVHLLMANPQIKIEIGGHTDNTGSTEYNQKLSENRARAVAEYLISSSVKADRITSKGYGMRISLAANDTDEGRAQNRRTEMKVVE
jgi:flagellar motor protein MotB